MDELMQALNRLLEAERAGVEALVDLTRMSADIVDREMLQRIGGDEAWACASLREQIEALGGVPSRRIGPLLAQMRAQNYFAARLQLLAQQQQAVLESLDTLLEDERLPEAVRALLAELSRGHRANIAWCEQRAAALGIREIQQEGDYSGRAAMGYTAGEGREATNRRRNRRQTNHENKRSEAGRAEPTHPARLPPIENGGTGPIP
jgi:hypothetical protein